MPPVETKLSGDDRLRVAADRQPPASDRLRGNFAERSPCAASIAANTTTPSAISSGIDYNVSELFPNDGTGGSASTPMARTLFIPPLLVERATSEGAQQVLDRAIITPDLLKTYTSAELLLRNRLRHPSRDLAPGKGTHRQHLHLR
jgi:hypothetical protein